MSDVGRYRKLFTRLWLHPGFLALADAEKTLVIYLLTRPQSNRLGLYVLSIATAAEALGTVPRTIAKRLATVGQGNIEGTVDAAGSSRTGFGVAPGGSTSHQDAECAYERGLNPLSLRIRWGKPAQYLPQQAPKSDGSTDLRGNRPDSIGLTTVFRDLRHRRQ